MSKLVRLDLEASEEVEASMHWYEQQRAGLGSDFLAELHAALQSLQSPGPECTPVRGFARELGLRRKLLKRFPYLIIFIELPRAVRVIAVSHKARKPAYWRSLLNPER